MIKLIAETAWHHQGDYAFMKDLVERLVKDSEAHIIKMHVMLDFDEYMNSSHYLYEQLKNWVFSEEQWMDLVDIVRNGGKQLMLLANDSKAIQFAAMQEPELVELHSVCLNVPMLQDAVKNHVAPHTKVAIGVGGSTIQEVDAAVSAFNERNIVLFFGFQNFPTEYSQVNLYKIRKIQRLYPHVSYGYADHTAWNHEKNQLVTLLVAANHMDYVEKHVTTCPGEERCDYSAAISIPSFNHIASNIRILDELYGNGMLSLNEGERQYSNYGPMKMAPVTAMKIKKGERLNPEMIVFQRTQETTDLSQVELADNIGKKLSRTIKAGEVISKRDLIQ